MAGRGDHGERQGRQIKALCRNHEFTSATAHRIAERKSALGDGEHGKTCRRAIGGFRRARWQAGNSERAVRHRDPAVAAAEKCGVP